MKNSLSHLSPRIVKLLAAHGATTIEQVAELYPHKLLGMRRFGFKSLRKVEALLPDNPYFPQRAPKGPSVCQCPYCQDSK